MIHPRLILDSLTTEEINKWRNYHHLDQRLRAANQLHMACISIEGVLRQTLNVIESNQELRDDEDIQSRKENIRLIRRRVREIREEQSIPSRRYNTSRNIVQELFNDREIEILTQSQELIDEISQRIED